MLHRPGRTRSTGGSGLRAVGGDGATGGVGHGDSITYDVDAEPSRRIDSAAQRRRSVVSKGVTRLLFVHHTTSPALDAMFRAALDGANDPAIEGVDVVVRPALAATATDVLDADGYLLGTPANLGYMSGALKHFFDQIYYPCLEATAGRPYGLYVHGNNDTTGAVRSVEIVTTGLRWKRAQAPVEVIGAPGAADLDACRELGAALAAGLMDALTPPCEASQPRNCVATCAIIGVGRRDSGSGGGVTRQSGSGGDVTVASLATSASTASKSSSRSSSVPIGTPRPRRRPAQIWNAVIAMVIGVR